MTTATVDRFHVRWRVGDERRRRAVLARMLDDALPDALAVAGLGDGEVCVRRVDVPPVVLAADADDDASAAQWAAGIAEAVARAVTAGEVVRFRSPHHAVADMALGVARGDLARQWAWQAAGAWPAGITAPADALVAGLARRPAATVAALRAASAAGALPALVAALGSRRLAAIAVEALVAFGMAREAALDVVGAGRRSVADDVLGIAVIAAAEPPVKRRTAAPMPVSAPAVAVRQAAVAAAVDAATTAPLAALALLGADPSSVRNVDAFTAQVEAVVDVVLDGPVASAPGAPPTADATAEPVAAEPAEQAAAPEPVAHTTWGGLLLCLHAVDRLDVQPSRRLLYLVGLALLHEAKMPAERAGLPPERVDPHDPALLAFCGLSPSDDPPAPTPEEDGAVDLVTAVVEWLVAALPDVDPADVLELVCRRWATITADPGWIDVRFSLDDVSVDIRRAGLDLDPGFLPWLGAVVRFSYA